MQLNQAPKRMHKLTFLVDDATDVKVADQICFFLESRQFVATQADEGIIYSLDVMDEDSIVTIWIEMVRETIGNMLAKTQNNDQTK